MQLQDAAPQYIPCQQTVSLMCKVNFKPANAQSDKETHVCSMCVCVRVSAYNIVIWTIRKQSALPFLMLSDLSVCYLLSLFCLRGLLQCAYCCFWHFKQRVPHSKSPALRLFQSWAGHDSSNWLESIPCCKRWQKRGAILISPTSASFGTPWGIQTCSNCCDLIKVSWSLILLHGWNMLKAHLLLCIHTLSNQMMRLSNHCASTSGSSKNHLNPKLADNNWMQLTCDWNATGILLTQLAADKLKLTADCGKKAGAMAPTRNYSGVSLSPPPLHHLRHVRSSDIHSCMHVHQLQWKKW